MSREILYHSAIQGELREILNHYSSIFEALADDFWDEITSAFHDAQRFLERHHFDPSGRRRSNMKRFPFHFLFRATDSQVKVTVLRHNSRRSSYGARRS